MATAPTTRTNALNSTNTPPPDHVLFGRSPTMSEVRLRAEKICTTNIPVLLCGAGGTGKEAMAQWIHARSAFSQGQFVKVNCAAIPGNLLESELFGYEKGAFTGAMERRAGCFELAEEGTLLLDEIGEMPAATQAKLLRVLEDRKLRRLGSKVETPVDVRVLAATNKVPEDAVAKGELRSDLYYRLNVFNIHLPPLRDHKEDIPQLVDALLADMNTKHGRKVAGVADNVLQMFQNHNWPGNVRELRNTMERGVIVCDGPLVEQRHLPPNFGNMGVRVPASDGEGIRLEVGTTVGEAEKMLILKTLAANNNNKTRAADVLGISLKTLHNKLKEYGSASALASEAAN